jgi:hypothetical protein
MRNHKELVPHDQLPVVVPNIGEICEYVGDRPCQAAADLSVWADYGVTRHRWTESRTVCRNHADLGGLAYYEQALPITQQGRTLLTRKQERGRPHGTGGSQ